jgi:two-component system, NtrC family, nitrogen regulation response regulator GlnG
MDGTILIADDDRTIRTVLTQAFTRAGCKVHATASLMTLSRWVEEGRGDLVISDVVMPDGNGLETLPRFGKIRPDLPVIIISAQNTIMTAIKATEAEAYDYLPKPFDLPDLMKRSAKALEGSRHIQAPEATVKHLDELPLVGRTPVMQELYRLIARVLNTDLPVMIAGESGTGKSLIARIIHDFSDRRTQPFVVVGANEVDGSSAIQDQLARAKTGTILFDEIGDLSSSAQAQLVRAVDMLGEHAPRLLASTQQNLMQEVEAGRFRGDLFYRLNAVAVNAPPLRARIDDIPLLADYFLLRQERDIGEAKLFTTTAHEELRQHNWPGNVRQLEHLVRRLAVTCPENRIGQGDVLSSLGPLDGNSAASVGVGHEKLSDSITAHLARYFDLHGDALPPNGLYGRILRELETPLIEIALEATGGNQAKCAELLGINRNTLRKKITELDIRVTRRRKLM